MEIVTKLTLTLALISWPLINAVSPIKENPEDQQLTDLCKQSQPSKQEDAYYYTTDNSFIERTGHVGSALFNAYFALWAGRFGINQAVHFFNILENRNTTLYDILANSGSALLGTIALSVAIGCAQNTVSNTWQAFFGKKKYVVKRQNGILCHTEEIQA